MKDFSVYCKNQKEVDEVLKKLEKQGCVWISGHKPTMFYPSLHKAENTVCINIEYNKWITWNYPDASRPYTMTASEFLNANKVIIYTKGNQVIAKNAITKKEAIAKCHPDDEFDFSIGARLAFDRLMDEGEPIKEKPEYYNGKIVCIENFPEYTTVGKIYEIKRGTLIFDNGHKEIETFKSIDEINRLLVSQFIELVE